MKAATKSGPENRALHKAPRRPPRPLYCKGSDSGLGWRRMAAYTRIEDLAHAEPVGNRERTDRCPMIGVPV